MSKWFRHYVGMMRDEKLVGVAVRSKQPVERAMWIWGAILESASEINDGGRFELDCAEAAYFLRADEADIRAILDGLADAGRLDSGCVVKWGDRQYQSDGSKERQSRYRERQKSKKGDSRISQSDAMRPSRDAEVTPQDTDTDTDVAKATKNAGAFDDWYSRYPHKVQRGAAEKAFPKALKLASLQELIDGVERYVASKPSDRPYQNPATWLNGKGWLDQPAVVQPRGSPARQSASDTGYQILRDLENARNRTEDQNNLRLASPVRQSG